MQRNVIVPSGRDAVPVPPGAVRAPNVRVLTLTTLFPSGANPRHGIFVETRLRKLRECSPVDLRVIAPVPWFPVRWPAAGRYAVYAATPRAEHWSGFDVLHPRFVSIPRVGMRLQPPALAWSALRAIDRMRAQGWDFDVIDAHYLYPDGVAAAALSRRLQRPFVVTARGTDVNVIAQMPGPQRLIGAALKQASRIITVSEALKGVLAGTGVPADRIEVLRNGVDTTLFRPQDRAATRARLGIGDEPLIASVGNLVTEKGHDLVLRAAQTIDGARIALVGRGPEKSRLVDLAARLGLRQRVVFIDNVPQAELAWIYGAADVLALGSTREGWPNVLLEAMACGTPVVATDVGGVREIVTEAIAGDVVRDRSVGDFGAALRRLLARHTDRAAVRAFASRFAWEPVVRRYYELLAGAAHEGSAAGSMRDDDARDRL